MATPMQSQYPIVAQYVQSQKEYAQRRRLSAFTESTEFLQEVFHTDGRRKSTQEMRRSREQNLEAMLESCGIPKERAEEADAASLRYRFLNACNQRFGVDVLVYARSDTLRAKRDLMAFYLKEERGLAKVNDVRMRMKGMRQGIALSDVYQDDRYKDHERVLNAKFREVYCRARQELDELEKEFKKYALRSRPPRQESEGAVPPTGPADGDAGRGTGTLFS